MKDLRFINGIIKILETPCLKQTKDGSSYVIFRAYFPQILKTFVSPIVQIYVCEQLTNDILKYYVKNDYILIEGNFSIHKKNSSNELLQINVQKIFPFYLNS